MATNLIHEGQLAEENVTISGIANGDTYVSKLSDPKVVMATLCDTAAGTAMITASLSGRTITFGLSGAGSSTGTAYVTVKGRL